LINSVLFFRGQVDPEKLIEAGAVIFTPSHKQGNFVIGYPLKSMGDIFDVGNGPALAERIREHQFILAEIGQLGAFGRSFGGLIHPPGEIIVAMDDIGDFEIETESGGGNDSR
jgi:hypothetical protein